jgi:hypothetical protein
MKPKTTRRIKPKIESKNKSYTPQDSPFYKLTTKKRLEKLLDKSVSELDSLSGDQNYRVFIIEKEGKKREIQAPMFKLDAVQTRIASLLVRIMVPDYLQSGIKGRSNITNSKIHLGDHPVLTMDIKKFYPSITKKSIFNYFCHIMKSAPDVAGILAELCTYQNHIPTGSRLSMPLSFWVNFPMYNRINTLCITRHINFSVFVDDFTFSGLNVNRLHMTNVKTIVSDAGLTIHPSKNILYSRETPKLVTGVILNKDTMTVRNKHHKAIYTLFSEMPACKDDEQLLSMQKELIGRLSAAGQIDPKFKTKASQLTR